ARITAKIDAQFADFREQTIDVARIAGGFAAALAGGDVNTGAEAAGNAAENNYLSSAQIAQMKKELEECSDDQCRKDINEKWFEIDEQQGRTFATGVMLGLIADIPIKLSDLANDLAHRAMQNILLAVILSSKPWGSAKATLNSIRTGVSWAVSEHAVDDVWGASGQFWGGVRDSFLGADKDHVYVKENFEKAGVDGAFNAGFVSGRLAAGVLENFVGGVGVVKGGIKLAGKLVEKDLIKFASKAEEAAITGAKVGASTSEVNTAHVGKEITQSLEKMSDEVIATQYFGQERKFWSKPIEVGIEITNKGEKFIQINKVYQREDLFDPNRISEWTVNNKKVTGTNIERMKTGRAPIGFDNKPVELHHMLQTHDGPIAEVTNAFHNKHHSAIRINSNTMGSAIDRDAFALWRQKYWKERAERYIQENNLVEKSL
ncbi:HNH/ENDO VII family nuclease, partial [Bartonella acomydis]|uniref:HNH/ENDO VII family nuclease n=1 Tax=Bartonella acomydis TaxID=686234 RepID=UPI0031F002D7